MCFQTAYFSHGTARREKYYESRTEEHPSIVPANHTEFYIYRLVRYHFKRHNHLIVCQLYTHCSKIFHHLEILITIVAAPACCETPNIRGTPKKESGEDVTGETNKSP